MTLLLTLGLTPAGCNSCNKAPPLATLSSCIGPVGRDHAQTPNQWVKTEAGDTFFLGDGIKTATAAVARLAFSDGSTLAVQEGSVLRFLAAAPEQKEFKVELGEVRLEAGTAPLRFQSSLGLAVLEPGGRMLLKQDGHKTRYEVTVGMASFSKNGAEPIKVMAGQRIQVDLETALIERLPERAGAVEPAPVAPPNSVPDPDNIAAVVTGRSVRFRTSQGADWAPLAPGKHSVASGGTFDIPARARVKVTRGDEAATMRGRGQFKVGGAAGLVETAIGRVSVDRALGETTIVVPGGSIVIRGVDGAADVAVAGNRTAQVRVREGSATLKSASGSDDVGPGETRTLDGQGHMQVQGHGPEVADLVAKAGESFVVHDPMPPTAVEVAFPAGCKSGRLRLGANRIVPSQKAGSVAIASLSGGAHRYAVVCDGAASVSGVIQILRDPGTADLPRRAPATLVDVDGKKYTILYQNLLPEVRVSWPKAPKAKSYQLVLTTGTTTKTFATPTPRYVFKSSTLSEGNHVLAFKSEDAAASASPSTPVKIRFDNAAPAAVVRAPPNNSFKAGVKVAVAGSALPGWVVTAAGSPLPLDSNFRFVGQVVSPIDQRSLAIRFEHKERGVHYYLRRSSGRLQ